MTKARCDQAAGLVEVMRPCRFHAVLVIAVTSNRLLACDHVELTELVIEVREVHAEGLVTVPIPVSTSQAAGHVMLTLESIFQAEGLVEETVVKELHAVGLVVRTVDRINHAELLVEVTEEN